MNNSTSGANSSNVANRTATTEAIEDPVYGPLERASKVIEERLTRDERWFGVGETLTGQFKRALARRRGAGRSWEVAGRGGVKLALEITE